MRTAVEKARLARLHILEKMNATLSKHRDQLSEFAPRIITVQINPSKIGDLIGPGGKMIRSITEETGAKIDINDDGLVMIASTDGEAGRAALARVQAVVEEAEVGKVYNGIVRRITDFGAFVEILPNTDGLVHISELDVEHVKRVEDIVKLGDRIEVKVISIDNDGRVRLSRRVLLPGGDERPPSQRPPSRGRDGGNRRSSRSRR